MLQEESSRECKPSTFLREASSVLIYGTLHFADFVRR